MGKLVKARLTAKDVEQLVAEYDLLRLREADIKRNKEKIADQLKLYADSYGVEDGKGSKYVATDTFIFGKQARTSVSFVQDVAVDVLTKRGYIEAIDVVRTVNDDKFEQLVGEGKLTVDEFIDLGAIATKTTYAVFVKKADEMSEVEVSALKRA
jgi:hypothetical protein